MAAFFARSVGHKTVVNYLKGFKSFLKIAVLILQCGVSGFCFLESCRGIVGLRGT